MTQTLFCLEIISFTALTLSSIFLSVAYIPHERKIPNVRRSKNLIQLASILLGVSGIILTAQNYQLDDIIFYVQIMAQVESALLILGMILLLTNNFPTRKFVFIQTVWIAISILALYSYYYIYKGTTGSAVYYLLVSIFPAQFLYFFFTYKKLFEAWRNKKHQYGKYGSTIKRLWLLLNIMATFVMATLYFPGKIIFAILISVYIIALISFTILFYRLLILLNITDFEPKQYSELKSREKINTQKNMEIALEQWIESKGYVERNITITILAKRLGTNRTYLSNYINERYEENFNTWINQLRIKEAQILLEKNNEALHSIAEQVGFADLPHFSRTFKSITGESPSNWKKRSEKG